MSVGEVNITILDGGASIVVPLTSVQVVMGCTSAGTANQIYAVRDAQTLASSVGYGAGVDAAGLSCLAGGTVLYIPLTRNAAGTASAVTFVGTGTSVVTVTLDGTVGAFDDFFVLFKVVTGGTRGTTGITFQISLDAGRQFGPTIALNTATTYAIPNTGITLNFAAGTLIAGDTATFGTVAPAWNTAGVLAAVNALRASDYAVAGWGSMHLVGPLTGANCTTIQGYVEAMAPNDFIYTRMIGQARDVSPAAKWGGTAEAEATWYAALGADYAAVSAKRMSVSGGHYNMPSPFPNIAAGAPAMRRPLSFAAAAKTVAVPPQRHLGRVRDGSLQQIVIDSTNDAIDGFIYHDEALSPALTAFRFMAARKRKKRPGWFIDQPNLMAPAGSDFSLLPFGNVIDIACVIAHEQGSIYINEDIRLNPNGTIYENEARSIEAEILGQINAQMTSQNMISSAVVVVDRTTNVRALNKIKIKITIFRKGYILSEDIEIGFSSPTAAAA